jgi:molybdopterin-guanine dinucleotide biosynthesis protein A
MSIEGFILAGGKSSRMGTAKAELMIGGISMIDRAARVLSSIAAGGITVVGGPRNSTHGLLSIPDPDPVIGSELNTGAIVGVQAAFAAARGDWIAVLACDLPFVSGELLQMLARIDRTGVDAVVPVQSDGFAQPLCALYKREPCQPVIYHLVNNSDRSMRSLLSSIDTRFVNFQDLKALRNSENFFLNVNSPGDYARAVEVNGSMAE